MRSFKRLLTIFFVLVLSSGATAADSNKTGDKYLEHIYADEGNSVEVMAVWSDTLNIRKESGLSCEKVRTAKRGETVIYLEPTLTSPKYSDDGYFWRSCQIGASKGWVAEDFLIEKCYFDALEPALEFYDAGELKSMQTYLEKLDRNYIDVDCEIASDGGSALVAFSREEGSTLYTNRLYVFGATDRMIYSDYIHDYLLSDDGKYTAVSYNPMSYGWGYSMSYPYTIFDNQTDAEVFSGYTFHSLGFHLHAMEFVGDSHFLIIDHDDYAAVSGNEYTCNLYPRLKLVDLNTGSSIVLLDPDWDWLATMGYDISSGVKLRRNSNCSSPTAIIKAALKTKLFHNCEEMLVSGLYSEA